jgi:hypothetical protein
MLPRKSLIAFLVVALATETAHGQPSHHDHWSLEARIASADAVVVGPIVKVNRKVIRARGELDERGNVDFNGQYEYAPAVKVEEVLKGDLKGIVDDLDFKWGLSENHTYEEWQKAGNSMLWFLGPAPKPGQRRAWKVIVFGKEVPAEAWYGGRREPPMYSMDFTVLPDEKAVLALARKYARTSKKVMPTGNIRFGLPWNDLVVPIEPATEPLARRLVASPQDFVEKGQKLQPRERYQFRYSGVQLLSHFKSDANVAILKSLLADPLEDFENSFVRQHPVRVKAFEVLLHWGVDTPLPKPPGEVNVLLLADTAVTDAQMKQVAELRNLERLDLEDTKITAQGLKHLAGLKKLAWLRMQPQQLSDASLRVLREIGLLHALSLAYRSRDSGRPRSAAEVDSLSLWKAPVTDDGLKELADLKNLTWLDLRDTRVTDVGLKELARMKKLRHLLLHNTHVTDVGVAALQKALPKCKINRAQRPGPSDE